MQKGLLQVFTLPYILVTPCDSTGIQGSHESYCFGQDHMGIYYPCLTYSFLILPSCRLIMFCLKETEIVICYCVQSRVNHGFLLCPEMQTNPEEKSILRDASQWEVQYGPQRVTMDRKGSSNSLGLLSTISTSCKHQQEIYSPLLQDFTKTAFLPFNFNLNRSQFQSRWHIKTCTYTWSWVNH